MRVGYPGQISRRLRYFQAAADKWLSGSDWPNPRRHKLAEYHERSSAQPQLRPPIGERDAKLREAESKFRICVTNVEDAEHGRQTIAGLIANAMLQRQS